MGRQARQLLELQDLCEAGSLTRAVDLAFLHFADFGRSDEVLELIAGALEHQTPPAAVLRRVDQLRGSDRGRSAAVSARGQQPGAPSSPAPRTRRPPMSDLLDPAVHTTPATGGTARTARSTRSASRSPMSWGRRIALAGGIAYLLTFVFSIPTLAMKGPLDDPAFVLGVGSDTSVIWASLFDVLAAFACIATAVALYPVTRRQSTRGALGFVTSRLLEAGILVVGAMSLLSIVTLRQDATGDPDTLVAISHALLALHDWAFLLGPGVMAPINALLLGSVMYRSGLVPRWIPAVGLIGAPFALASAVATVFGLWEQVSGPASLAVAPVALWELSLGLYLTFKGFRPSPLTQAPVAPNGLDGHAVAA